MVHHSTVDSRALPLCSYSRRYRDGGDWRRRRPRNAGTAGWRVVYELPDLGSVAQFESVACQRLARQTPLPKLGIGEPAKLLVQGS